MSRKGVAEYSINKTTRSDRYAQMSRVEQVIEQKKREIQARLQCQKQEPPTQSPSETVKTKERPEPKKNEKSAVKSPQTNKQVESVSKQSSNLLNIFSNDGSFLDKFKQLSSDKPKSENKTHSSSGSNKGNESRWKYEKDFDRNRNSDSSKSNRWSGNRKERSPVRSYKDETYHSKSKKYSIKNLHPTSQSRNLPQLLTGPGGYDKDSFPTVGNIQSPQLLNTRPPITNYPPPSIAVTLTMVPPPPRLPEVQSTSVQIPPPNIYIPMDVSVPPPVIPCETVVSVQTPKPVVNPNIPPLPTPLQLQNIPPPSPICLNEIPDPKPLDLMNIPAPGEAAQILNKTSTNLINTDVIKNIPPPNKSVPPPNINSTPVKIEQNTLNVNVNIPPPNPVVPSVPVVSTSSVLPSTGVHSLSNAPHPLSLMSIAPPQFTSNQPNSIPLIPPPTSILVMPTSPPTNSGTAPIIPALMAQPVPPPPEIVPSLIEYPMIQHGTSMTQSTGSTVSMSLPPPVFSQPPPTAAAMNVPPPSNSNPVCLADGGSDEAMKSLARMVAQCGDSIEEVVRQRNRQDLNLRFLFNEKSSAYQQYRRLVEQFKIEFNKNNNTDTSYAPMDDSFSFSNVPNSDSTEMDFDYKDKIRFQPLVSKYKTDSDSDSDKSDFRDSRNARKRKRKSRWGGQATSVLSPGLVTTLNTPAAITLPPQITPSQGHSPMLSKITRNDPALIQYALNSFGKTNLTEEEWQKAEDHYKINLLYQDMLRKRQELESLQKAGKHKYEYDSDEDIDGGTWEHKLRMQEMEATKLWATELTKKAEGKHHIGDFLPPDEFKKFMEQSTALKEGREPDLSDYKEYKLKADNVGFKMLQKLGWSEGQGLGVEGSGIVEPINKAPQRDLNQGLGMDVTGGVSNRDDEYESYRKRMMLAYRFRPNPLNNPRRPYY